MSLAQTVVADVRDLLTYTANEGKLEALNARFPDHTVELFKKHSTESVGYWVPADGEKSKNTLNYFLKYESREAAAASFKAFGAAPPWNIAAKASIKVGKILAKQTDSFSAFYLW
jgi:hypothetical protein